jgi:hypothetical protein
VTGDIVLFMSVLASLHRPWVAQLLTPYTICFGIAMLVSVVSLVSKSERRMLPNRLASTVFGALLRFCDCYDSMRRFACPPSYDHPKPSSVVESSSSSDPPFSGDDGDDVESS